MAQRILRPLTNSDLFDETFDIYKSHFFVLAGIAVVMSVPTSIIRYFADNDLVIGLLLVPFYAIEFAATTWAISQCYLGRPTGIIDSYKAVCVSSFSLIMSLIFALVILYIGLILCVVPGILVSFWLVFIPPVVVIEQQRYIPAINRSRELAGGNWGRIFTIGILIMVFCWILMAILGAITGFAISLLDNYTIESLGLLYEVGGGLFSSLFTIIPLITLILLYYDIRVRKEAFDIEMLARDLDASREGSTQ